MKNRRISRRFLGIFCLALVAMCPVSRAWGYHQLGSDRVLLMNNDTNVWNQVSYQGYNDTDHTKGTYWVHSTETGYGRASYLVSAHQRLVSGAGADFAARPPPHGGLNGRAWRLRRHRPAPP